MAACRGAGTHRAGPPDALPLPCPWGSFRLSLSGDLCLGHLTASPCVPCHVGLGKRAGKQSLVCAPTFLFAHLACWFRTLQGLFPQSHPASGGAVSATSGAGLLGTNCLIPPCRKRSLFSPQSLVWIQMPHSTVMLFSPQPPRSFLLVPWSLMGNPLSHDLGSPYR